VPEGKETGGEQAAAAGQRRRRSADPAYEAMQDARLGQRVLDVLMRGVSTRQYQQVLPEMAETYVSREAHRGGRGSAPPTHGAPLRRTGPAVIYIDGSIWRPARDCGGGGRC
jgi:hypothetical protein